MKDVFIVFPHLASQRLNDKPIFHGQQSKQPEERKPSYELLGSDMSIIVDKIAGWCKHNKLNNRNMRNDEAWTYNSISAWCELMPWITVAQMKRMLQKLEESGWIKSIASESDRWDKVKWYSLGPRALAYSRQSNGVTTPIEERNDADDAHVNKDACVNVDAPGYLICQPTTNNQPPIVPHAKSNEADASEILFEQPLPPVSLAKQKRSSGIFPRPSEIIGALRIPEWLSRDAGCMLYFKKWLEWKQSIKANAYIDLDRALTSLQGELDSSVANPDYAKLQLAKAYSDNWKGQHLAEEYNPIQQPFHQRSASSSEDRVANEVRNMPQWG